jgi:hypothetical protein
MSPLYGGTWGNGYERLNSQINQSILKIPYFTNNAASTLQNGLGDADQGNTRNRYRLNFTEVTAC